MNTITVVDYGAGNLQSVNRQLLSLGVEVIVSSDPAQVAGAEKIVLPGVGHFGNAMENLRRSGLVDALQQAVQVRGVPILGICLGMQLMAHSSTEGNAAGLGWFDGAVVRFDAPDSLRYKIPHMGWNEVRQARRSRLMEGIPDLSEFYFVHSYHYVPLEDPDVLLTSDYCGTFACGIERRHIFGVQFHPEKSHDVGLKLLRNFTRL